MSGITDSLRGSARHWNRLRSMISKAITSQDTVLLGLRIAMAILPTLGPASAKSTERVANPRQSVTGHTVFPRRCPLFPLPHFRIPFLFDRPAVLREHASGIGYSSV